MAQLPEPAAHSGFMGSLGRFMARFGEPDIRVGQLMLLWVQVFLAVIIIVIVFFVPLVWIFS